MQKPLGIFLALATVSAAHAQYPNPAGQQSPNNSQAAPIVQAYPGAAYRSTPQIFQLQPSAGVSVRSDTPNAVQTVTASSAVTELRIAQGRADVVVHHPADHSEILVDLPGGQVSLLKDGLYTFNASTNMVRVLHGEAEVGATPSSKGTKVKETQQLVLTGSKLKSVNAYPFELTADLLPSEDRGNRGDGPIYSGRGDGFYGPAPYYAGLYPYGYGYYPYGYGYPIGLGIGFGYYGGFGGYRGGFRR